MASMAVKRWAGRPWAPVALHPVQLVSMRAEAGETVRALPPELGGETPAAALTAYAGADAEERALASGYQAHIAKPVEPSELSALVAGLTEGAKTR